LSDFFQAAAGDNSELNSNRVHRVTRTHLEHLLVHIPTQNGGLRRHTDFEKTQNNHGNGLGLPLDSALTVKKYLKIH
jgi:hypothetical protein